MRWDLPNIPSLFEGSPFPLLFSSPFYDDVIACPFVKINFIYIVQFTYSFTQCYLFENYKIDNKTEISSNTKLGYPRENSLDCGRGGGGRGYTAV